MCKALHLPGSSYSEWHSWYPKRNINLILQVLPFLIHRLLWELAYNGNLIWTHHGGNGGQNGAQPSLQRTSCLNMGTHWGSLRTGSSREMGKTAHSSCSLLIRLQKPSRYSPCMDLPQFTRCKTARHNRISFIFLFIHRSVLNAILKSIESVTLVNHYPVHSYW